MSFDYFLPREKRTLVQSMFARSRDEGQPQRLVGCVLHTLAEADAETELTVAWLPGLSPPAHLVSARPRSADECLKQETEVWRTLAVQMGTAPSLDAALERLTVLGCEALSQTVGCSWTLEEGRSWVCRTVVAKAGAQPPEIVARRKGMRQGVEQGAIARGAATEHFLRVLDVRSEPGYPQGAQLAYLGMDSAVLVPVRSPTGDPLCVFEYLGSGSHRSPADDGEWWSTARALGELAPVLVRLRDADAERSRRAETSEASSRSASACGLGT